MIPVTEAKDVIFKTVSVRPPAVVGLRDVAGLVLAEDVFATQDFPPFRQSAMDGYAIRFADLYRQPLLVAGEVQAGGPATIKPGCQDTLTGAGRTQPLSFQAASRQEAQAVRIFTGAPVPEDFDTVVMQEKVSVKENYLYLDGSLTAGSNIRAKGSEMQEGELALPAGTLLTPGAIGLLAGLGKENVKIYMPPVVFIIVTGRELRQPGCDLEQGQVYESNSFALGTALKQAGIEVKTMWVDDKLDVLKEAINHQLAHADLLLVTGGMSVGSYDYGAEALRQCGIEILFHKITQKPGKPMLFGKKEDKLIFGLPGNPSSVLTCFYEYVLPCIRRMCGNEQVWLEKSQVTCANHFAKKPGLTQFLKGRYEAGRVTILDAQESYRMRSFAYANCLVMLDENISSVSPGDLVEIHRLP